MMEVGVICPFFVIGVKKETKPLKSAFFMPFFAALEIKGPKMLDRFKTNTNWCFTKTQVALRRI